jgi:hypothetical protein
MRVTANPPIHYHIGCAQKTAQKKPRRSGAKSGPSCGLADLTPVARHLGENGLRALAASPPLNAADASSVAQRAGETLARKSPAEAGLSLLSALCWVWQSPTNPPTQRRAAALVAPRAGGDIRTAARQGSARSAARRFWLLPSSVCVCLAGAGGNLPHRKAPRKRGQVAIIGRQLSRYAQSATHR